MLNSRNTCVMFLVSACAIFDAPLFPMTGKTLSNSFINRKIKERVRKVKKGKADKAILDIPINGKTWNVVPLLYRTYHEKTTGLDPVEQLLAAGADPNVRIDNYNRLIPFRTPLANAAQRGTSRGMALLLTYGARASENSFLIYYLTTQVWSDTCPDEKLDQRAKSIVAKMKFLLAHGADPNYKSWAPPLCRLVQNMHQSQKLLNGNYEKFSNFKLSNDFYTNWHLRDLLLYHGANPYLTGTNRKNAIDCAREAGDENVAQYLERAPLRNVTMLTTLLLKIKTKNGKPLLPFEIAHKIADFRYRAGTVINHENEIVFAVKNMPDQRPKKNDEKIAEIPELEYNTELFDTV